MQKNESLQYSSNEKSIIEGYMLIYEMAMDKMPEFIPIDKIAKEDPYVRESELQYRQAAWKQKSRHDWLTLNPSQRHKFLWTEEQKKLAYQRKLKKMHNCTQHNKQIARSGQRGQLKYTRHTFDEKAANYDSLIKQFDICSLDNKIKDECQWNQQDRMEPGIETSQERTERHRQWHREKIYKKDWDFGAVHGELQQDAMKLRNLACVETFLLTIADASPLSWRCATICPISRAYLELFNDPKQFSSKKNFFWNKEEKERLVICIYTQYVNLIICMYN